MSDWQTIESAPKDGTRIQLNNERGISGPCKGHWDADAGEWVCEHWWIVPPYFLSRIPTHWKPLSPKE